MALLSGANESWAQGRRKVLLTEATTKQCNPCQVRRKTDYPCPYQAVVEICGIPFCAACARRQEAYFAIGELTQEAHGLRRGPLVGALESMRRGRKTGAIALAEELEAISNN
jgi:hypothetical protein